MGRFRRNVSWYALATLFNQGSTFAVNVVVAHVFGRDSFGRFAIVQTTLLTFAQIAQLATGYTANKYVAEFRSTQPVRAGRILGFCSMVALTAGLVAAAALLLGAPWLARAVFHEPQLIAMLRLAAGAVLFTVFNTYLLGGLAGLERFNTLAVVGVISGLAYTALALAGGWAYGLTGAVAGIFASTIIQTAALWRAVDAETKAQGIRITLAGIWQERSALFRFALPAAAAGLTYMPAIWVTSALLVRQPNGFAQMGLFTAANNFRIMILMLPNIVNTVGLTIVNHAKGSGDARHYRRVYWTNLAAMMGAALVGALGVVLFGPLLLRVFGRDFAGGYQVLTLLAIAAVMESLWLGVYQVLHSKARMWLSFAVVALPRDVLLVGAAALLVPISQATGLATSHVIAHTIVAINVAVAAWWIGLGLGVRESESTERDVMAEGRIGVGA